MCMSGADPEFEKGGGVGGSPRQAFLTNVGQFRGLFNEFGTKRGGRATPAPPPPPPHLDPRLGGATMKVDTMLV